MLLPLYYCWLHPGAESHYENEMEKKEDVMERKCASPRDSDLLFSPLRDVFHIPPSNTF